MSQMISSVQGESQKIIDLLFEHAKECQPSLILMEECDSVGRKRTLEENDFEGRIKQEFLKQIDGVLECQEDVTFIATTNVPWELDGPFLSRFERRILVPLLSERDRLLMIRDKFKDLANFNEEELARLAKMSFGFSGFEIGSLVNDILIENCLELEKPISEVF